MITHLTASHASETAHIHFAELSTEFLPSFGVQFLTILHRQILSSQNTTTVGYLENKHLLGFAIATTETQKIVQETIVRNFWRLAPFVLKRILFYPIILKYIFHTLSYGKSQRFAQAELLIIAVSHTRHQRGIGSQLIKALCTELEKKRIKSLSIATVATNSISNAFYKHLGAKKIEEFRLYNKNWNIYTLHF